jgi:hypothetical protein|tara:strand:- start:1462 stop:1956 length:495 start_codon:yes stop_codon:yes gene_type:complete
MPIKAPTLIANYLPNAETILDYAHEHGKFVRREEGTKFFHQAKRTGPISAFSSWFIAKDHPVTDLVFEHIPQDRKHCTQLVLNKYEPGDYLVKHMDASGGYWKFLLIYLTAGPEHFCWWDNEGNQHFIKEQVGAMLEMDIGLYHAVTEIQPGEPTKYSLCLLYE